MGFCSFVGLGREAKHKTLISMSLGLLPNPATKKSELHPEQAKHAIDLLTMLEEKTQGNRTPEESSELELALHELRLVYVSANRS